LFALVEENLPFLWNKLILKKVDFSGPEKAATKKERTLGLAKRKEKIDHKERDIGSTLFLLVKNSNFHQEEFVETEQSI
jgi:hypothetical protein